MWRRRGLEANVRPLRQTVADTRFERSCCLGWAVRPRFATVAQPCRTRDARGIWTGGIGRRGEAKLTMTGRKRQPPIALLLMVGVLGAPSLAWAQDATSEVTPDAPQPVPAAPALRLSVNFGVATDYASRGRSWSDGRAAAFGGLDLERNDLYAGVWTSNVKGVVPSDRTAGQEVDTYVGWRPQVGGYQLDLAILRYDFLGLRRGHGYWEASAQAGLTFGPLHGRVGLNLSPDYLGDQGRSAYADVVVDYAVTRQWQLNASLGRQTVGRGADYTNWSLGLRRALGENATLEARYVDTDAHRIGSDYEARGVLVLKAAF